MHGSVLLYVHRNHKAFQDGEPRTLDFHTAPELWREKTKKKKNDEEDL